MALRASSSAITDTAAAVGAPCHCHCCCHQYHCHHCCYHRYCCAHCHRCCYHRHCCDHCHHQHRCNHCHRCRRSITDTAATTATIAITTDTAATTENTYITLWLTLLCHHNDHFLTYQSHMCPQWSLYHCSHKKRLYHPRLNRRHHSYMGVLWHIHQLQQIICQWAHYVSLQQWLWLNLSCLFWLLSRWMLINCSKTRNNRYHRTANVFPSCNKPLNDNKNNTDI